MTVLVVGASGETGRLLVNQLLGKHIAVRIIVRDAVKVAPYFSESANLSITQANILEMNEIELQNVVDGCDAIASCLGHNITFKGVFGKPHFVVADSVKRLCKAVKAGNAKQAVKFVLMNTTGNRNKDLEEKSSPVEKCLFSLLRNLVPPQKDNEEAAEYLRCNHKNDKLIEWVAVRPDGLFNEAEVSEYAVFPSPIRSPLFNAGVTSRINVAHFMAELIQDSELWQKWKSRMPVIYNKSSVL
ncbi:SDR family oxidoreductase [Treponema sp.]